MAITKLQSEALNLADDYTFTGTVSGTSAPAFQAYMSANQTGISDNVFTKVQFDTELFDTNNMYDHSTNYRFTPTVAGKYYVYALVTAKGTSDDQITAQTSIYKNGSIHLRSSFFKDSGAATHERFGKYVGGIIEFNGSTDYVEVYGVSRTNGGPRQFDGTSTNSTFGAYKISN